MKTREEILQRLKEIEARAKAIGVEMRAEGASIETLTTEVDNLSVEKRNLETQLKIMDIESGNPEQRSLGVFNFNASNLPQQRSFETMDRDELLSTPEYRSGYLKRLQGKDLTEAEKRALTTGAGSAAAAVPTTTLNLIVDKLRQTSVLYNLVKVSFIPGNLNIAVANAKNDAAWKPEGTDGTPADDTTSLVNLTGYELIKLVEISAAAEAMTIDAFETYVVAEIGRRLAIAIENAILNGDGTGEPTGILSGVVWNAANSITFVGEIDYDTIVDALALLPTMYHPQACFCMNRKMLFGGIRKIKDADGRPIFIYNAQDKAAMSILGYPVTLDDYMPDDTITLCDLNYYYLNFSKSPEITASREASFKSGKITYRGLLVADGKPALDEAFVKISK
jgi:HK97 family phage major capsid protein